MTIANKETGKPGARKTTPSRIRAPRPATLIAESAAPYTVRRLKATPFARIVAGQPLSGLAAIQSIREGYAAGILKAASSYFGVPDAQIRNIAQVPASTASRLEKNQSKIDSAATERVYRMGAMARMAIEVFGDEAAAIAWMRQPNRVLGDAAPLDLMDTEPGAISVRQLLNAIATGGAA